MTGSLEDWREFNTAMLGATAALAGLVIVAMSVNIATVVASRSLTSRIAAAIAALVVAIASTALGLMPGLTEQTYGVGVAVLAVAGMVFAGHTARTLARDANPLARARTVKGIVAFLPFTVYLAGGVLVATGAAAGLVVVGASGIVAIAAALLVAWIALVEVLR